MHFCKLVFPTIKKKNWHFFLVIVVVATVQCCIQKNWIFPVTPFFTSIRLTYRVTLRLILLFVEYAIVLFRWKMFAVAFYGYVRRRRLCRPTYDGRVADRYATSLRRFNAITYHTNRDYRLNIFAYSYFVRAVKTHHAWALFQLQLIENFNVVRAIRIWTWSSNRVTGSVLCKVIRPIRRT